MLILSKLLTGLFCELFRDDVVFFGLFDFCLLIFYIGGFLEITQSLSILTLLRRCKFSYRRFKSLGSCAYDCETPALAIIRVSDLLIESYLRFK